MAYRRSLLTRGNFVARKCYPSIGYVVHNDERKCDCPDEKMSAADIRHFLQRRFFGNSINGSTGFAASSHDRIYSNNFLVPCSGYSLWRHMSTAVNHGSDKIEVMSDVAEVLTDTTVDVIASQVPAVSEVAIAAADSHLPVKALQYFIDSVHSFTGLNWWASIVLTTLVIRSATLPLTINQLKSTAKLTLMRPHLDEIKQRMQDKGMDPQAVAEGQKEMKNLFKEYGVSPFSPMKGIFIQGPIFISFFLAVTNMSEKMPSFKTGGASWFLDLTTPDPFYILPFLTALSFLITVEFHMQEGLEGNPVAGTMKNISRGLAVVTVPFTASFPKAIFCYWITSNLFSLVYGAVLKVPGVKKTLGIPEIPVSNSAAAPQSPFSFFPALKQASSGTNETSEPSTSPVESSKAPSPKISSSAVLSQRVRSLERQVKAKKKNKKRYGVIPFSPMKRIFIQGPIFISFFLAVTNMSEKMPSFKTGGASWFLDLTTPDPFYILPSLTPNNGVGALLFLQFLSLHHFQRLYFVTGLPQICFHLYIELLLKLLG
ncbi:hypothetical protein L6164_032817 [Bauhinia variegata]|uniref:Uncharacterized protein n=1 Tax=Bauhinia variegata TaxID=167791 RepID=A0ACB9KPS7_BAUVA|nr:hypothetical protein L6164_032817 [Bauhinia variegata]